MRGKVKNSQRISRKSRITPACAGKSGAYDVRHIINKDHPRVCGEKSAETASRAGARGSPPRVRGKAGAGAVNRVIDRITPACAGKSHQNIAKLHQCQDHPRVCGEKSTTRFPTWRTKGSPPRVRGKALISFRFQWCLRITPACAGKSIHHHAHKQTC